MPEDDPIVLHAPRFDISVVTRPATRVCMTQPTAQLLRAALELLLREVGATEPNVPDQYRVVVELAALLPAWRKG